MTKALLTTVVGSYPQPDWLIDRERLGARLPPRVRARELWRVPKQFLEEAQDDATRLAVDDMRRAGVDIVTDGEMRRLSFQSQLPEAVDGFGDWGLDAFLWGDWHSDELGDRTIARPGLAEAAEQRGFDWLTERVGEVLHKAAA